jgi:hypothetical protein
MPNLYILFVAQNAPRLFYPYMRNLFLFHARIIQNKYQNLYVTHVKFGVFQNSKNSASILRPSPQNSHMFCKKIFRPFLCLLTNFEARYIRFEDRFP